MLPSDPNLQAWLTLPQNLTETIKKSGLAFSLVLVKQVVTNISPKNFVREVLLYGDSNPLIFAQVLIPYETYLNYQTELDTLGDAPIGNAFLYHQTFERTPFEFKAITPKDPLAYELKKAGMSMEQEHWLRQSTFILPKGQVFITEVFLSQLPKYPKESE